MFFDSRLGWRWYAVLAIVVAVSFGSECWLEMHFLSNFIDNHIALGIPANYTVATLFHHELILVAYAASTGIIVMIFSDLLRPFTGYFQMNWLGKRN